MKIKRIFFYIILVIMFLIPAQVSAAEYKVCVYQKSGIFAGNIYAAAHVVGSSISFDIFSEQTGLSAVVGGLTGGATGNDSIQKTCNLLNSNQNAASPSILIEECPPKICEDNYSNNAWIDTGCRTGTNTYIFLRQVTEASVSGIDNALAFSFQGGNANIRFSSILGTCPAEVGPFKLLGLAYTLLKIIAPIALLLFASLDIAKAVAAGDDGKVKKAQQAAMKRLIAAMIVFLSFVIVQYIVKLSSNGSDIMSCVDRIIG